MKSKVKGSYVASHLASSYYLSASITYRYYKWLVKHTLQLDSYIHAHMNEVHPPAHLQDLIPTLAGVY